MIYVYEQYCAKMSRYIIQLLPLLHTTTDDQIHQTNLANDEVDVLCNTMHDDDEAVVQVSNRVPIV